MSTTNDDDETSLGTNDGVAEDDEPGVSSEGSADEPLTSRDGEAVLGQTTADGIGGD